jgi:hypothetical protein
MTRHAVRISAPGRTGLKSVQWLAMVVPFPAPTMVVTTTPRGRWRRAMHHFDYIPRGRETCASIMGRAAVYHGAISGAINIEIVEVPDDQVA